jgi:hypothetical protein
MRDRHWQDWTQKDFQRLRELAEAKLPIERIAAELGRTQGAIGTKAQLLGLSLKSMDRGLRRRSKAGSR